MALIVTFTVEWLKKHAAWVEGDEDATRIGFANGDCFEVAKPLTEVKEILDWD